MINMANAEDHDYATATLVGYSHQNARLHEQREEKQLKTEDGEGVLSAEASINGVPVATDPDVDLLKLIARQAGANPMIGPGARILARFPGAGEATE